MGAQSSDLFYPGNPERRERLTRKHIELLDLMKDNFRATNQLIETLKKHLGLSFSPIAVNEKASVKENCDIIIKRIHEIQAEVEKIDTHLKEKLEPTLYEKLSVHLHTPVLNNVVTLPILFETDMIAGAIGGSIARSELEKALEEYEKALDEFWPASAQYQDSITVVRISLEMTK